MEFSDVFRAALSGAGQQKGLNPYPCQTAFAASESLPHLLRLPTGAGKTATAVLGWLYRRRFHPSADVRQATPRRLVYCLPMRVLVEQTQQCAKRWLSQLGLLAERPGDEAPVSGWSAEHAAVSEGGNAEQRIAVSVLMGGEDTDQWFLHPEHDAVLIGTQDMLLSRALNRGFAAGRFHWPIDFALLNSDCLWVFDEPQLMGSGVSTSAQLAGLRQSLCTAGDCSSVWMSATLEPEWLDTVDFAGVGTSPRLELGQHATGDDLDPSWPLHRRMTADKTLYASEAVVSNDMKAVAKAALTAHEKDSQTLVILNTVSRAKTLFQAIEKTKKREKKEYVTTLLVHSRFRPPEREALNAQLQDRDAARDRIIVATQVVEAGVDLSSRTLITELAPWSSIVQRIGRCNRTGNDGPGQVFWIDLPDRLTAPYSPEDLDVARDFLQELDGQSVSPLALTEFKQANGITLPFEHRHVLRRRDLLDVFDTAPDLSGNDIDVQRFVRGDDPDTDVQVFWRGLSNSDVRNVPAPERRELCSVPIGKFRDFLKANKDRPEVRGFVWDHIDEAWRPVRDADRDLRPGVTVLLPATAGGYSELGWDSGSRAPVTPLPPDNPQSPEAMGSDAMSSIGTPLTIAEHTPHVCEELDELLASLGPIPLVRDWAGQLGQAARWHDVGKAHEAFQHGMRSANQSLSHDQLWAKSGSHGRLTHGRRHFRHELASALVALQRELPFAVAYLIAAHHGRVRLSIRAMPDEPGNDLPTAETLFALGVYDGDPLPDVDLGSKTSAATALDLSPMQLGGEASWTARALDLLGELGPFRLAYLEALLRIADRRASAKEAADG